MIDHDEERDNEWVRAVGIFLLFVGCALVGVALSMTPGGC